MYRLTKIRLEKARHILEKYRDKLYRHFHFDAGQFEMELRKCWNLGYQELKSIAKELYKDARYQYVAIYYMEHSNAPGVVVEFQRLLSEAYGVKWYHAPDLQDKRDKLWDNFRRKVARQDVKS